jgi:flagellar hook-length control protein FliK
MNSVLAALLLPTQGPQPASSGSTTTTPMPGASAQFKTQFDTALAAVTASANGSGTNASTSSVDTLTATLQKKIAALLAGGTSVSEIVQQLSTTLANAFAAQFGGDPAQIRNQLQSAFASALAQPANTGPPLSATDLASALADRFRQVAEIAAGVNGETGQPNRLFAGSFSDAASTAGEQPAPDSTTGNGTGPTTAASVPSDAFMMLASLTASPGDGKTVALNGAPALGSNGDTLLGRILARATQSLDPTPSAPPPAVQSPVGAASVVATNPDPATALAVTPPVTEAGVSTPAQAVVAALIDSNGGSNASSTATAADAPQNSVSPALATFLKTFSDALAKSDAAPSNDPKGALSDSGTNDTLLPTSVTSTLAPTVSAFVPVQAPFHIDTLNAQSQPSSPAPQSAAVDPNSIVEQVLRGAFLTTTGSSSEVRMKLVPESLGDLSVKLTVNNGNVDARIVAQTPAAQSALLAGQSQLTRSLADAGLKLTSFNVDLAGGFAGSQQQQQQSSGQPQSFGRPLLLGGVDTADDDVTDAALVAMPSFGPPLVASQNLGLLNYLA